MRAMLVGTMRVRSSCGLLVAVATGCGRLAFDPLVTVDASTDAITVPLCERFSDALLCTDFAQGDLDDALDQGGAWSPGGGFDGTDGWTMTASPGETPRLTATLVSPVLLGPLHIGARVFVASGPPQLGYVVLVQATSPSFSQKVSFDLTAEDRAQVANDLAGDSMAGQPATVPRGRWICVELAIAADTVGGLGNVDLRIDGTSVLSGWQNDPTAPAEGFGAIQLAAISAPGNVDPLTVVFDNWVVRQGPIGCP